MRTILLSSIAGAALLAGGGLATAQMETSPDRATGAYQGSSQRQPGAMQNPAQRSAEPMQGATQGRSSSTDAQGPRSTEGMGQGRSGTMGEKEQYRSHSTGATRGTTQGRSSTMDREGSRSMEGMDQGRFGAKGERGQHRYHRGAMQSSGQGRSVASSNLSADQRTRLHDILTSGNLRRADRANFALSVGTRIPRNVRIYGLPGSIVELFPQFRGFDYIVVGSELLVVDPRTLQIVDVLPV
jgi:hypothetical protein